ncbi:MULTISPECIES: class I SAM-dependent methyltransferase [Actinokineospora]|uniref:Methyltransferase n=1 Tax=Actinokineospora fastidiosa TaxID=1816 RepID=A0A918GBD3_9PSEU|nr:MULTISPECIES: methyltransferase domain-containing protein [Actinokineospora]UVS81580.1 Trans-aconitate methyltransferase [Actinokineospora sp. UTMC 2448]GGS26693.1 methyltransferase [Actinokineospora fastidiosa]
MAETAYCFDTGFDREAERLALGEALWDPGTVARLAPLVGPGARCLEVGAGHGSVARWMVARGAEVTAVDRDVSHLDVPGGRVVAADIRDGLPGGGYDVVHARLLVQHLANRLDAVRRMADALRPGGHLVLEDTDTAALFSHADGPFHDEVKRAAYAVMRASGYHPRCGLLDVELAEAAGLADVRADARAEVVRGGSAGGRWFALWLEHLRPRLTGVEPGDVDRAVADLLDPRHTWLSQVMVTVIGRKVEP